MSSTQIRLSDQRRIARILVKRMSDDDVPFQQTTHPLDVPLQIPPSTISSHPTRITGLHRLMRA